MALKLFTRKTSSDRHERRSVRFPGEPSVVARNDHYESAPCEHMEEDELRRSFQQGRFAMILREERKWEAQSGGAEMIQATKRELERHMALVPAGRIAIARTLNGEPGSPEEEIVVDPFLLDVHAVTNARFQKFVDAGGYDALEYWPEEIWPHLIELKDLTGQPGPRLWRQGRHDSRLSNHPIVGVSWYEAQAYALWIGQRLPSEAEWEMAASWHLNSSTDMMRRFPWGDSMDNLRCNIWPSRHGTTVPVSEYPDGAAPNHVLQLVGNVWEWTDTEFAVNDDFGRPVVGEMPMHVVRGGAFDTYFESQATSHFRTGQIALARTPNTGFRCAMDLNEVNWLAEN